MSLPWRYGYADDYVNDTLRRLKAAPPSFKHLKIGKFYLHSDDALTTTHIRQLLSNAQENPNINELSICEVCLDDPSLVSALIDLLHGLPASKEFRRAKPDDDTSGSIHDPADGRNSKYPNTSSNDELYDSSHRFGPSPPRNRTWKKVSLTACKGHGAVALAIPPGHIIKHISITKCNELSDGDYLSLGMMIRFNPHLTSLELGDMSISRPALAALSEGIKVTRSLTKLEFSSCIFDDEVPLARALCENSHIKSLGFSACELGDEMMCNILRSLCGHPMLKELNLFRNHCGENSTKMLSHMLSYGWEHSKALSAAQSTNFVASQALSSGAEDSQVVAHHRIPHLSTLNLSHQFFERATRFDTSSLSKAFAHNDSITHLVLSFNKFNDYDAIQLAESLFHAKTLKSLDLRANNIKDLGVVEIADKLVNKPTLEHLCLFGNPFRRAGSAALLRAVRNNFNLKTLSMDYNLEEYDQIQYYVNLNLAGRKLLSDHSFPSNAWPIVFARVKRVFRRSLGQKGEPDLVYSLIRSAVLFR